MRKSDFKILFLGTPEFAVASLKALYSAGFNIAAVVTAPDKPAGRGLKTTPSPIKIEAEHLGLTIWQPEKLKSPEFVDQVRNLNPDLGIVVAFRMLPEIIWRAPRLGTFNLHASLLPKYRGAAPIQWAIANGETETGVTTFFLKHEIDTGNILFQETEPIHPNDTGGTLYDRLMLKGADLVVKTTEAIFLGNYTETPQPSGTAYPTAPKIQRSDGLINFELSATEIYNRIRAFNPFPGAYCLLGDRVLKIWASEVVSIQLNKNLSPGELYVIDNKRLICGCKYGLLEIKQLQLEGKKLLNIDEFLRGNILHTGTKLSGKTD